MGNQLKSLRQSCPVCKKTAVIDVEFEGKKVKFAMFCPHCYKQGIETLIHIEIKNQTRMFLTSKNTIKIVALILVVNALLLFIVHKTIQAERRINCNAFKNYIEAQNLFNTDTVKYKSLDKNNNGIPCETLLDKYQ